MSVRGEKVIAVVSFRIFNAFVRIIVFYFVINYHYCNRTSGFGDV